MYRAVRPITVHMRHIQSTGNCVVEQDASANEYQFKESCSLTCFTSLTEIVPGLSSLSYWSKTGILYPMLPLSKTLSMKSTVIYLQSVNTATIVEQAREVSRTRLVTNPIHFMILFYVLTWVGFLYV